MPVNLQSLHTFAFPVQADELIVIHRLDQLQSQYHAKRLHQPYCILGGGSNVVFRQDFHGLVLKNEIKGIDVVGESDSHVLVAVGGGEVWDAFVELTLQNGWYGLENLSLIPGTVGASPIQNIGAYGVEMEQFFHSLTAFDLHTGQVVTLAKDECGFAYRDSIFKWPENKQRYFISHVCFQLNKLDQPNVSYGELNQLAENWQQQGQPVTAMKVRQWVMEIRRSKLPDPNALPNAGSFFKNLLLNQEQLDSLRKRYPDAPCFDMGEGVFKVPTAWLLDRLGWKGYRTGEVGVHQNQPLVLVHYGQGQVQELIRLASTIQEQLHRELGIDLVIEPEFV